MELAVASRYASPEDPRRDKGKSMCYMIAVGRKATRDGSVLVARNCDSVSTDALRVVSVPRRTHPQEAEVRIPASRERPNDAAVAAGWTAMPVVLPQVSETYAYTAIMRFVPGDSMGMVMGGINEHQVSAGASTGGWVKEPVERLTPWPETVIGDFLMTLVLERCRTAREAVEYLGEMTMAYGGRTDNYILADPQEAWLFEQYQGTHWAAARVPDDCFVVEANSFRLADIDPDDPDNYLCDPDLIPFAEEHGLWNRGAGEPFHAARAYTTNDRNRPRGDLEQPYYSLHRIWRGIDRLAPSLGVDPYELSKEYPLFVRPDRLLDVSDLLDLLKDQYEGTELDEYGSQEGEPIVDGRTGHYRRAPAWCASRLIGCPQTITSWVTQSRSDLPNEIGGILWGGLAATASGPHIPWYAHNTRVPAPYAIGDSGDDARYRSDSAYWLFENIGNLINLFHQGTVDLVRPRWDTFDRESFVRQATVERAALEIHREDPARAVRFLTDYSCGLASDAWTLGHEMLGELFTRIALLNNPQTSRAYEDPALWSDRPGAVY